MFSFKNWFPFCGIVLNMAFCFTLHSHLYDFINCFTKYISTLSDGWLFWIFIYHFKIFVVHSLFFFSFFCFLNLCFRECHTANTHTHLHSYTCMTYVCKCKCIYCSVTIAKKCIEQCNCFQCTACHLSLKHFVLEFSYLLDLTIFWGQLFNCELHRRRWFFSFYFWLSVYEPL